jgi:HEAT repeat protein
LGAGSLVSTAHAIAVLVRALDDDDARVRVAAAKELLDRGHGKPASVADVTLRHGVDPAAAHLEALIALVSGRAPAIERDTPTDD